MTIGIIGAGNIGKALAGHLSRAGYQVLLSNSKKPDSLKETAEELGLNVRPVWAAEAAKAEIIVLSVPWAKLQETIGGIPDWENKTVIDTTNNILSISPFKLADLNGRTTGEFVAGLLPGAHVVKAFNTLGAQILGSSPVNAMGNRVIVMSGDDQKSKTTVAEIISSIGFQPVDLGDLSVGGKLQEVGASLSGLDFFKRGNSAEAKIEIVRKNTEEVQGKGNFEVFDQLFADNFIDNTPQPGFGNDKESVRNLYKAFRLAFPDLRPEIHWMTSDGDKVTTYKTYHGTHQDAIFGIEASGKKVRFETVDVMRVRDGKITEHWGVANLLSLIRQLDSISE